MKLYFITEKWMGKNPVLMPRVPTSRPAHESDTPRICVAPTISGCYLAINGSENLAMHVYVTESEHSRPADKTVTDKRRTGERWLLEPTRFQHVLKMPKIKLFGFNHLHSESHKVRVIRQNVEDEFRWQMMLKTR